MQPAQPLCSSQTLWYHFLFIVVSIGASQRLAKHTTTTQHMCSNHQVINCVASCTALPLHNAMVIQNCLCTYAHEQTSSTWNPIIREQAALELS